MTPRPDQIADQIEGWIASQFPNSSPADVASALDMVRRRATMRAMPGSAGALTITPDDIVSTDGEALGRHTRQQLFDAVHAWDQICQQGSSPSRTLWHHTPDYAIHVNYEPPVSGHGPHYVHLTAYHQDTRPGQEQSAEAFAPAIVHWQGAAGA